MLGDLMKKVKPLFSDSPAYLFSRAKARRWGTVREREWIGLLERPYYAYGLLRAADGARFLGKNHVTVCEFGVAAGNGLVNLVDLAALISSETGVQFRIVGFDTGEGLPEICGYADHPELWRAGDFPMVDRPALIKRIDGRAELIFGDIEDTVDGFVASLDPDAPLGFVSIDVDIYTASKSAMRSLQGPPELYLPGVSMYFDDISSFFSNRWCGELRAIEEFNQLGEFRKIDIDRSMEHRKIQKGRYWHERMYICHVLDHERRTRPASREAMTPQQLNEFLRHFHLT